MSVFGLRMVTVPLFARLLSPTELGTAAAAMTLVMFLVQLGGGGLTAALVIQKEEEADLWDTVFWTSMGVAALLAGGLWFGAETVAGWLGAVEAAPLLRAMCLLFPLTLAVQVSLALMARRMQFHKETRWTLLAELVAATAAIWAAFQQWGAWAIVLQQYVSSVILLCGLTWAVGYRPRARFVWRKLKGLLGYSFGNLGADLANFVTYQGPLIVVTRTLGVATGGGFSLAGRLSDVPIQVFLGSLMSVLFPTFSSVAHDVERRRKALLAATGATTAILAPLMFGLWALAEPVTVIVLGDDWRWMWPALGMLAVSKALMSPCGSYIPFMKGVGRGDLLWWFAAGRAAFTIASTIAGAILGGLYGATVALALVAGVITVAYSLMVFRVAGIRVWQGLANAAVPLLLSALMGGAVRLAVAPTQALIGSPFAASVVLTIAGAAIYAALFLAFGDRAVRDAVVRLLRRRAPA